MTKCSHCDGTGIEPQRSVYDELLHMGFKKDDLDYAITEARESADQPAAPRTEARSVPDSERIETQLRRLAEKATPGLWTEAELLVALRRRFTFSGNGGSGRYAFLTHVRTGAAFDQQEIDAVVVCLWPSDHHAVMGFEVKCSRTDWLREIRPDTSKSERTRRLCDSFTIVAPANVVELGELPTGWGLLLASHTEGGGVRLYQQVKAEVRQVVPGVPDTISRSFVVAMLRASGAVPGMTSGLKRKKVPDDDAASEPQSEPTEAQR